MPLAPKSLRSPLNPPDTRNMSYSRVPMEGPLPNRGLPPTLNGRQVPTASVVPFANSPAVGTTAEPPVGVLIVVSRLTGVRLTEFHELVDTQFGVVRGRSLLVDHVLTGFGGRSAAQAVEDGVEPRDVWRALCADFDVPRDQW